MEAIEKPHSWIRTLLIVLGVLVVIAALGGAFTWYKFFREEPQPDWITQDPDMRFKYGSIGAECDAGMPVLDLLRAAADVPGEAPGPGGYAHSVWSWRRQELPIGFTKKSSAFRASPTTARCAIGKLSQVAG